MNPTARKTLNLINRKSNNRTLDASGFEKDVHQLLCDLYPFSILPNVRLFSPSLNVSRDYGFEMDNLLHLEHNGVDYIIVVEVKNQTVEVANGRWTCTYPKPDSDELKKKDVREQLDFQIQTLREYLSPLQGGIQLQYLGVVVSSNPQTEFKEVKGRRNTRLLLCSYNELPGLLIREFREGDQDEGDCAQVHRVNQSGFLSLLRLGQRVPTLGHPELPNAIRYVERCRRELDNRIFEHFNPTERKWAINGSAGMGKSVLLAYTACVLSCGHELAVDSSADTIEEKIYPIKANRTLQKMGFAPLEARNDQGEDPPEEDDQGERIDLKAGRIGVLAMSDKQLQNLRLWYEYFVDLFNRTNPGLEILYHNPIFFQANLKEDLTRHQWSALLVDEAHDLKSVIEQTISKEFHSKNFFLCVACDRHQKLQHISQDAKLIEGLNFSRHTERLKQIYRNPTSIYIASLALMFRWFGGGSRDTPKVIPTKEQLTEHFGFKVDGYIRTGFSISLISDAHPANEWSHTVASFPDVETAFTTIEKSHVPPKDVLWVRFSQEEKSFDYETLQRHFTYHNCRTHEADDLADKYIKGQDYHIVVIEGFPSFMDDWSEEKKEQRMWKFRRELYLCASRATSFLYFVCNNPDTREGIRIRDEISLLVESCSQPVNLSSGGVKCWEFQLLSSKERRPINIFTDTGHPDTSAEEEEEPQIPAASSKEVEQEAHQGIQSSAVDPIPSLEGEPDFKEKSEPHDGAGYSYTMEVSDRMTVEDFSFEMGVEPKELIRILRNDFQMQAAESSLLEIPMMQRIAAEKYDCEILDLSEPKITELDQKKAQALDLITQISKSESDSIQSSNKQDTKTFEGVVDHINLKRGFVVVKYAPDRFIPIYLEQDLQARNLNRGNCVKITISESDEEYPTLLSWEEIDKCEIDGLYQKFTGMVVSPESTNAGFLNDGDHTVFIPPAPLNQLSAGQINCLWAIRDERKDRQNSKNWIFAASDNQPETARKLPSREPNKTDSRSDESEVSKAEKTDRSQKIVTLRSPIIVSELAEKMGKMSFEIMADLIKLEVFVAPNQAIKPEIAEKVAAAHGFVFKRAPINE